MKEEFKGFSVVSDTYIRCGDCDTKLMNIVTIETNQAREMRGLKPQTVNYKIFNCPKCKGSSFSKKYAGSSAMNVASNDIDIDYVDTKVVADEIYTNIYLKNAKK